MIFLLCFYLLFKFPLFHVFLTLSNLSPYHPYFFGLLYFHKHRFKPLFHIVLLEIWPHQMCLLPIPYQGVCLGLKERNQVLWRHRSLRGSCERQDPCRASLDFSIFICKMGMCKSDDSWRSLKRYQGGTIRTYSCLFWFSHNCSSSL